MSWSVPWLVWLIALTPTDQQFRAAASDLAQGHFADAAAGFLAVADSDPDNSVADDALMRAAEIYDERLGDPRRALEIYERVIADHPRGRLARRARIRAERLREGLGPAGEWADVLRDYEAIRRDSHRGDPLEGIERMRALLAASPEFSRAADAKLWIGNTYARDRRMKEAEAWFRKTVAEHPGADAAWRALRAEGDSLLARGAFGDAERVFRALAEVDNPTASLYAGNALQRIESVERRTKVARWAWAVIGLFAAGMVLATRAATDGWRQTATAFWRPPAEVVYLLFPAVLLAAAAVSGNFLVAHAVLIVLVGGVGVTWLSGSALAAARARGHEVGLARALTHAVASALAIASIVWIALLRERLFEMLVQTW